MQVVKKYHILYYEDSLLAIYCIIVFKLLRLLSLFFIREDFQKMSSI